MSTSPFIVMPSWHPVAASEDLVERHVFQGQLLGRELALWRAADGHVNVWENRCLHRGVRLSIGTSDGRELVCQYHGWRYANRTAECTYIPAHPADAPARTVRNRTFRAVERYGLVWTALEDSVASDIPELAVEETSMVPLRAVVIKAPAIEVVGALLQYDGSGSEQVRQEGHVVRFSSDENPDELVMIVQPTSPNACVVRGLCRSTGATATSPALMRFHDRHLSRLRDRLEAAHPASAREEAAAPAFDPVPEEIAGLPDRVESRRATSLRVRVARKWETAEGVAAFELEPLQGELPTAQPGAHLDVHLPSGDVRQYSLVNGPGESTHYVIGVKKDAGSRGGSLCLHDVVKQGDVLAISEPRNNFPLRRDATTTLLVAGGIGITPLLAMAQTLHGSGLDYRLHYFAQSQDHLAFRERLDRLGTSVVEHLGLDAQRTAASLSTILADYRPGQQVYVCGPGPMLEATRGVAIQQGWPVETVHFEYFRNDREIDKGSTFQVALARSCLTVEVAPGQTILEAIREAGVDMPSSCEQGACGTCVASVIEGTPEHQDVYLNPVERDSGDLVVTCVSRCSSSRLVLDL